jgi:hypothetical protein
MHLHDLVAPIGQCELPQYKRNVDLSQSSLYPFLNENNRSTSISRSGPGQQQTRIDNSSFFKSWGGGGGGNYGRGYIGRAAESTPTASTQEPVWEVRQQRQGWLTPGRVVRPFFLHQHLGRYFFLPVSCTVVRTLITIG